MPRFACWRFHEFRCLTRWMVLLSAPALAWAAGTPVTLQLKWFHQFQFAGYYAAQAQGYYQEAGLDVRFREGAPQVQPVEEVLSGRAQFGITDSSLLLARAEGRPVVALAAVFQHSPAVLAVHFRGPGQDLQNLAGKKVMLSSAVVDIAAFLRANGLTPDRLTVVPHSFDIQDLVRGRVDAMTAYSTDEIYDLDRAGFPYHLFSARSAGIDFYGDILFTDEKEIRAHPDRVKAFRDASMRGWQYAMAHPEEMAALILNRYPGRVSREHLLYEAGQMVPLLQPDLVEMGYMNPERWKRIGDTFVSLGMLKEGFNLRGFLYSPKPDLDRWAILRWAGLLLAAAAAVFAYQAHRSNSRFRSIFNSTNDALFIHDLETGAVLDVNQRATEMYGYTRDEIRALPFESLCSGVPPHTAGDAHAWIRKAAEGRPQVFEWLARDRSRRLFWVEVNMRRTTISGQGRLVVSVRDIAERKAAEDEKARLQAQLIQAQKMESLGVLAGGVAHDMNNVLGAILGLASANQEKHPPDSQPHRIFATISQAAARGGQVVQSLLKFAHQAPAGQEVFAVNDVLQDVANLLEHTTLARIHLEMRLAPDLRPVLGDASSLTYALVNLCVNSVDAMADGGTLTLGSRNLDGDRIEISVTDDGCGMAPEIRARVMEPFFTTKPVGKGTGLGLSMAYSAVMAHRGQMDIQTEPGKGTRITIVLPCCPPGETRPDPGPTPAQAAAGRPLDILLVDDDDIFRESVQEVLRALGHSFTAVASGEEALARLGQGLRPDLVILDMNMPGLGGKETLPRVREVLPEVPVLIATGRADQVALALCAAHPGVALMAKPFSFKELRAQLARLGIPR